MPFWREGGSVLPPPPPPTRKPPLPPNQPKTGINVTPKTPPPMHVQPPPLPEPLPATPMAVPPPPPPTAVTTRRQVMPPAPAPYSPSAQPSGAILQYEPSAKVQAPQYSAPRIPSVLRMPIVGQEPTGEGERERRVQRRVVKFPIGARWNVSPLAGLRSMGFASTEDLYSFLVSDLGYSDEYAREVVNRMMWPMSYGVAISSPRAPEAIESPEAAIYHLLELQRAANYNPQVLQRLRNSDTAAQLAAFYSGNLAVGWPDFYAAEQGELPYIDIGGYPFDYSMLVAFAPTIRSLFGLSEGEEQLPTAEGETGGGGGGYGGGYGGGGYGGRAAAEDIAEPSEDVQPPSTEEPAPRVPRNYEIASWLSRLIKVMPGRVFQFPEPARRVLRNMGLADELWKILLDLGFKPVDIGPDGFPTDVIVPEEYNYDPNALTQYLNGLSRLQRFVLRYLLAVNFNIGEIPEPPKKLKPPKPTR